jgi:hypothetical protein
MPHQSREADARPDHGGSERVPKPAGIRLRDARGLPVMTKQRTQTGRCHPVAAGRPFERNEQGLTAVRRSFQTQVVIEQFLGITIERQDASLFALTRNADL